MIKIYQLITLFVLMNSCNSTVSDQKDINRLPISKTDAIVKENIEVIPKRDTLKESIQEAIPTPRAVVQVSKEEIKPASPNKKPVSKVIPEATKPKEVVEEKIVENGVLLKKNIQIPNKPSHEIWDKLTKTYVFANGKVNYAGFKSTLTTIDEYLVHLQDTPPTNKWSKNEKLAYWFNLYNASTVYLVAINYPVKSIKDINGGNPWDKKFIKSGTALYSLNEIENTVVRPNFNESRLHVAFNCAAISCPNLLNEAFTPTKLNVQLNSLSRQWINDPSKNKIAPIEIQVSQIFNWYSVDFKEGIIPFINNYSQTIKVNPDAKITFLEYDWQLNE